MPDTQPSFKHLIIIGAGIAGLCAAFYCRDLFDEITIFDPDPLSATSWVAGGMLAPVTESHFGESPLTTLNLEAARIFPEFLSDLQGVSGCTVDHQVGGTISVAKTRSDLIQLDQLAQYQLTLGLKTEKVSVSQLAELVPKLSSTLAGGYIVPQDTLVGPRSLLTCLGRMLEIFNIEIVQQQVLSIEVARDKSFELSLGPSGKVQASHIVLAAGCGTRSVPVQLPQLPHSSLPIRPVRGQILRLQPQAQFRFSSGVFIDKIVRGLVDGRPVYILSRADGEVAIGATSEEAGYNVANTFEGVFELMRAARDVLPAIMELEIVALESGLRPTSPDNLPVIGPLWPQLFVSTGFYRNGILLGPKSGALARDYFVSGNVETQYKIFSPQRFFNNSSH